MSSGACSSLPCAFWRFPHPPHQRLLSLETGRLADYASLAMRTSDRPPRSESRYMERQGHRHADQATSTG